MRILLFMVIICFCFSCKKEIKTEAQVVPTEKPLDSLSKDHIRLDLLKLSSQGEKDLETFEDFQNLRNLSQTLKTANPYYVKKYADSIQILIQVFDENLSEDLNVNTINSRISVLMTESGLLKQVTETKNPKPEKILEQNTRLLTAYNSLIVQLNELSLAIPENIEKELLRDLNEKNKEE